MSNRFDFEQQIMKSWSTADDVELIYKRVSDHGLSGDDLANALLGVYTMHALRSEELFEMFEDMIGSGVIK